MSHQTEWVFPMWGVSLRAQQGSAAKVFPIWEGLSQPADDCDRWPYLLGVSFVISDGTDFTTGLAEFEASFVETNEDSEALLFDSLRIPLVYVPSASIVTLIFQRGVRFPAVEGQVPRLFARVNPVVSPPPLPTWSFRAWGEYRPRFYACCAACQAGKACECEGGGG